MKTTAALLILLIAVSLAGSDAAAERTFGLLCRAGGTMTIVVAPDFRRDRTRLEIRFRKARFGGRDRNPPAGECAWMDRPLRGNEPERILVNLRDPIWVQFRSVGAGHTSTGVTSSPRTSFFPGLLLRSIRRNGQCFLLNVFNNRRGFLEVGPRVIQTDLCD